MDINSKILFRTNDNKNEKKKKKIILFFLRKSIIFKEIEREYLII